MELTIEEKDLIKHLILEHKMLIGKFPKNETLQADIPLVKSITKKLEV